MQNDITLSDIIPDGEWDGVLRTFTLSTGFDAVYAPGDGACAARAFSCSCAGACGRDAPWCAEASGQAGRQALLTGRPCAARCGGGAYAVVPVAYGDARFGTVYIGPGGRAGEDTLEAAAGLLHATVSNIVRAGMTARLKQREIDIHKMHISNLIMEKRRAEEAAMRTMSGSYPMHKEKELMTNVRLGDKTGARRILNEMLGWVFLSYEGNMDVMKARIVELLVMMSRAAVETGAPLGRLLAFNNLHITELSGVNTFEQLCAWVVSALDAFMELVYSTRNERSARFIGAALNHMREHYAEPLTLASVAKVAHVSPYYLSHMFREELGETFLERLTFIRMDKAKELLRNTGDTIASVAAATGYEDAGYFSKVFRKTTGQTPNHYRGSNMR